MVNVMLAPWVTFWVPEGFMVPPGPAEDIMRYVFVALTIIGRLVPFIAGVKVSVAVTVCGPEVFRVRVKVPVPLDRVESIGKTA